MTQGPTERRRFLAAAVNSIQALIGGTLAVLLGGAVVGPSFLRRRETWLKAGSLDALTDDEPMPVTIRVSRQDGFTQTVERQVAVSYTHLRAHETGRNLVCRLLL